jgi:CheY-like chemotaxis protein
LKLESEPGKGSIFTCYVPDRRHEFVDASLHFEPGPEVTDPRVEIAAAGDAQPHLLLIEDDAVLVEQLSGIIRARGFQALVARTGEEGLDLARQASVVGIILDVRLPDLDGWTVMERLRGEPATRRIPVHFISAVDTRERGLALGAVGYLVKPATPKELTDAVSTLTCPTEGGRSQLLIVEDNQVEGESIAELLRNEPVDIAHVVSAEQALTALEKEPFGCMILDLGLPDMDGLALLETVRERFPGQMPRVVVHTGRSLTRQETRQLEAYSQAVIVKDERSGERLLEEVRLFVHGLREDIPVASFDAPPAPTLSLTETKILLAEDDMRTVYALSALLRGKGAEVLIAENGQEALNLLAAHPEVHAILVDIMMPQMDGYETMRRLRRDPRFAELPVIALTAKAMQGERERCIEAGASDYLTKPVDSHRLLNMLKDWLEKERIVAGVGGH